MNMLDDKGEDFYPAHDIYSHLSQIEWDAAERLSLTIGKEAVRTTLSAMCPDGQHTTFAKFIQNDIGTERVKVSLLYQQGSPQAELLR